MYSNGRAKTSLGEESAPVSNSAGMRNLICLLVLLTLPLAAQHHEGHHHHGFHEVERWIERFEAPSRAVWQKPDQVVSFLKLESGQTIADIGAGSGYFTRRFAEAVGPQGSALAVEIEPGFFPFIRQTAKELGLDNLKPHHAEPDDPKLEPNSMDMVFICDTLHHIENRQPYYQKVYAALKPGGRLVVVDFFKNRDIPVGPGPKMRLSWSRVKWEMERAGLRSKVEAGLLPYQYIVVGKK